MARLGAGTRKRADGTLEKRFSINGKRYSVYGKTTKEITAKEQALRKDIEAGTYRDNKSITLNEYFTEWANTKRKYVKANTLRIYTITYNTHIKPYLGKRKVQEIERRESLLLQDKALTAGISTATTNYILRVLKCIFNDAMKDEIITKNPCFGIKPIKGNETKATETTHRALTEQEQLDFMSECRNGFYYELIALLLCTGMRTGEAGALTWRDIDFKNGVIHINKTLSRDEAGKRSTDTPKSKAGMRDIPITETIKSLLHEQKKKRALVSCSNIIGLDDKVFCTVYEKSIATNTINREIKRVLSELNKKGVHIDYFSAHALRDTFATRYIEQGGQPQTLKTILGHASLTMTMDLYAHVLPNTKQEEMNKLQIII